VKKDTEANCSTSFASIARHRHACCRSARIVAEERLGVFTSFLGDLGHLYWFSEKHHDAIAQAVKSTFSNRKASG